MDDDQLPKSTDGMQIRKDEAREDAECGIKYERGYITLSLDDKSYLRLPSSIDKILKGLYEPYDNTNNNLLAPQGILEEGVLPDRRGVPHSQWRAHIDKMVANFPPNVQQLVPSQPQAPNDEAGRQFETSFCYLMELVHEPMNPKQVRKLFEETAREYDKHADLANSWSSYEKEEYFRRVRAADTVQRRLKKHGYYGLFYKLLRLFRAIRRFIMRIFKRNTKDDEIIKPMFPDVDMEEEVELPPRTILCGLIKLRRRYNYEPTF